MRGCSWVDVTYGKLAPSPLQRFAWESLDFSYVDSYRTNQSSDLFPSVAPKPPSPQLRGMAQEVPRGRLYQLPTFSLLGAIRREISWIWWFKRGMIRPNLAIISPSVQGAHHPYSSIKQPTKGGENHVIYTEEGTYSTKEPTYHVTVQLVL